MRSGMCDVEIHRECHPSGPLYCSCRCHFENQEPIRLPDVHGGLFAFSKREDGQVVLMVEDDGFYHPVDSFDPAWLMDLSKTAAEAARKFGKDESTERS